MTKRINISRDILFQKYIVERKSGTIISKELNVGETTVFNFLRKFNIPRRRSGTREGLIPWNKNKINISRKILYKKYVIYGKTGKEIAKELNIGITIIHRLLREYNFPLRKNGPRKGNIPWNFRDIPKDILYQKYIIEEKTTYEIAKELKTGRTTICGYLIKYKIPVRKGGMEKGKYTGSKNFNWRGGIMYEPYSKEFNNKLKEFIKKRDNFTCQLCYDKILRNTKKRLLTCHHIDYYKKNSKPNNLITLCHLCNVSVNKSREDWTKYFNKKIEKIEGFYPSV